MPLQALIPLAAALASKAGAASGSASGSASSSSGGGLGAMIAGGAGGGGDGEDNATGGYKPQGAYGGHNPNDKGPYTVGTQGTYYNPPNLTKVNPSKQQFEPTDKSPINARNRMSGVS